MSSFISTVYRDRRSKLGFVLALTTYCIIAMGSSCASSSTNCTNNPAGCYTVSGTVTGLTAPMTLILDDSSNDIFDGPDTVSITGPLNPAGLEPGTGSFNFEIPLDPNSMYTVTVAPPASGAAPPIEDCIVSQGGGLQTITADVTNIMVTCGYTIGGTLTGVPLAAGLVLQNNAGDSLTVPAKATSFTFATPVASGGYAVTVLMQPSGEKCTVVSPTGSGVIANANVMSVVVNCQLTAAATFPITVKVSGDTAGGLILQNNGGDNLAVAPNAATATFSAQLPVGAGYQVTVLQQPSGLVCSVANGKGNLGNGGAPIAVTCTMPVAQIYTLGGTVSGVASGDVLILSDGDGHTDQLGASGAFQFAQALAAGTTYAVTVQTEPTGLTCAVSDGTGTIESDVTSVIVTCTTSVGSSASPILATVTNVAASGASGYNSTISLYSIANPLLPTAVGSALTAQNVLGIAIDAANDIYYITNNVSSTFAAMATYYACPVPTGGAAYACTAKGTLAGGAWLALDASGNAYATSIGGAGETVVKFTAAGGPGATPTVVYTANSQTASFLGLAVSSDGSTLYVAESNNGSPGGGLDGLTLHVCSGSCPTDGTDITQTLQSAIGSSGLTGSLAIGPGNKLYIGLANLFGSTTAPSSLAVVAVCTPGVTFTCATGTQAFPAVEGDLNPFNYATGVAADARGNAYVAVALNAYGANTSPPLGPPFMGFQPPPAAASTLTPFICTTTQSNGVPTCPINMLPAPGVVGYSVPPYSMAVTLP